MARASPPFADFVQKVNGVRLFGQHSYGQKIKGLAMDKGAHFYNCDFQVHTPRDREWSWGG